MYVHNHVPKNGTEYCVLNMPICRECCLVHLFQPNSGSTSFHKTTLDSYKLSTKHTNITHCKKIG